MGVGAGIAAAAGIGAVGSAASGIIGAGASKSAAAQQAAAIQQGIQLQSQEFNQTQANLAPFMNAGAPAANQLAATLQYPGAMLAQYGLSGLTFQPTQAQLEQTPGYQFDLTQGLQAVQNSNAAQGLGVSGAAMKGAASYATGLANNTLTTQQGIFQSNLSNVLGLGQYLSNLGENAAATTGQQGIQATNSIANSLASQGAANAAGTIGGANALTAGLSGVGNSASNYLLYSALQGGGGSGYVDNGQFS